MLVGEEVCGLTVGEGVSGLTVGDPVCNGRAFDVVACDIPWPSTAGWWCHRCNQHHTTAVCPMPLGLAEWPPLAPLPTSEPAALSDADVDRIARRVVELLRKEQP